MKIGEILEDKYVILKCIGKGGMSSVYLAVDMHLNKEWAIKEISKQSKKNVKYAIREADLMKRLNHPGICRIVDIIENEESIYIIMDYVEGKTLEAISQDKKVSQEIVLDWVIQICEILIYLHHQDPPIIYRDIKPANIILQENNRIKIIDFGIAREYKRNRNYDTQSLGTIGYAAPEQYKNSNRQTDARTDIYGLGVTIHHLLTGISPTIDSIHQPITKYNKDVSNGIENIVEKCVEENPDDRYQSCEELLYAIENYEKEDNVFKLKIKRKFICFYTILLFSFFFLICGFTCSNIESSQQIQNYESILQKASIQNNISSKQSLCFQAIQLLPDHTDAYDLLIEIYKDEINLGGTFDTEKSEFFIDHVYSYLLTLKEENPSGYGHVMLEIGKLYWYYFDSTTLDLTRKELAAQWFKESAPYLEDTEDRGMAESYSFIGEFYSTIQTKRNEGQEIKGMYKEYFYKMKKLMNQVEKEDSIMHLEMDMLIVYSIESYVYDFAQDGISKEEVVSIYQQAIDSANKMNLSTEKAQSLKKEILSKQDEKLEMIDNAYLE